jgi:hypothetical protein
MSVPAQREGVEIRVEISTLLGLDERPGEIAEWGPVHAELARRLVRAQTAAEWRYAITDEDGHLLDEGITRRRPDGYPSRAEAPCRGGIVELQVKLSTLQGLAANPARFDGWAKIITDLAQQTGQADQREQVDGCEGVGADGWVDHGTSADFFGDAPQLGDRRGPRSPGVSLRRHTQIRDRTCVHPYCRAPAHHTDSDHTQNWADGGATYDGNIGSVCRHDHRLKHEGGWTLTQPQPGHFMWISRLGIRYRVRPPLIIQPLPRPSPRDPPPEHAHHDHHVEDGPTWREQTLPRPRAWPSALSFRRIHPSNGHQPAVPASGIRHPASTSSIAGSPR